MRHRQSWPSWTQCKHFQAVDQSCHGLLAAARIKPLNQCGRQLIMGDRRQKQPGYPAVTRLLGKKIQKVTLPALNCCPPYPTNAFETLQRDGWIFSLANSAYQQHNRCPIHPPPPKPQRRRHHASAAPTTPAAQAKTKFICLIKITGGASRFSLVMGAMQAPPAIGQPFAWVCSDSDRSIW